MGLNASRDTALMKEIVAAGWDQTSAGLCDVYCVVEWFPYPRYVILVMVNYGMGDAADQFLEKDARAKSITTPWRVSEDVVRRTELWVRRNHVDLTKM